MIIIPQNHPKMNPPRGKLRGIERRLSPLDTAASGGVFTPFCFVRIKWKKLIRFPSF